MLDVARAHDRQLLDERDPVGRLGCGWRVGTLEAVEVQARGLQEGRVRHGVRLAQRLHEQPRRALLLPRVEVDPPVGGAGTTLAGEVRRRHPSLGQQLPLGCLVELVRGVEVGVARGLQPPAAGGRAAGGDVGAGAVAETGHLHGEDQRVGDTQTCDPVGQPTPQLAPRVVDSERPITHATPPIPRPGGPWQAR